MNEYDKSIRKGGRGALRMGYGWSKGRKFCVRFATYRRELPHARIKASSKAKTETCTSRGSQVFAV